MTNEMIFTIYFTGIMSIALGLGAWCSLSTYDVLEEYGFPVFLLTLLWPIMLPLGMLFGAGYWAGPKLYAAFIE